MMIWSTQILLEYDQKHIIIVYRDADVICVGGYFSVICGKSNLAMVVFFFEKNPMSNKIKMFLHTLGHLNLNGREKIPTLCLDHPLLT